jgi:hypothetical protein
MPLSVLATATATLALCSTTAQSGTATYLPCLPDPSADHLSAKSKPSSCSTLGPNDSFASAVNLRSLRWTRWGASVATARGVDIGFHSDGERVPVRVTVSKPRVSACGDRIYTKIVVRSQHGTVQQTLSDAGSC